MLNPAVITLVVGIVVPIVVSVAWPYWLFRKKTRSHEGNLQIIDSGKVAQLMTNRADRLQERLDEMETRHKQQMAEAKAEWEQALAANETKWVKIHEADLVRIAQMQDEIDSLYVRLVRGDRPSDPKLG